MDTINSKKSTDKARQKRCENWRDRTTVEHPLKRPKCTDRKVYSTVFMYYYYFFFLNGMGFGIQQCSTCIALINLLPWCTRNDTESFVVRKFHPTERSIRRDAKKYAFAIVHAVGERVLATTLKLEIERAINAIRAERSDSTQQQGDSQDKHDEPKKGITFAALSVL